MMDDFKNSWSAEFTTEFGMRQGSVLSRYLAALCI